MMAMTRDELRIQVAEAMGWDLRYDADNNSYWIDPDGNRHKRSPDLDQWAWRFVVDLARKGYYLYGLSDHFAVFPVGRPSDHEEVCRDAEADVAVCTAWLAVCAKGDDK